MIKIENTDVYGWEAAIRGLRNPLNSWQKSDSFICNLDTDGTLCDTCYFRCTDVYDCRRPKDGYIIGKADLDLMHRMNASSEQSKYRRMIIVTYDVTAPLFWLKEKDTYKVGTVCNSCSTMHKIHAKPFTIDDFSFDETGKDDTCRELIDDTIALLNKARAFYLETNDKKFWRYMIELLPSSYNQRRTYQMNYEVLASIYRQRKNHKLTEWHTFCDWIKSLPYSELITGETENDCR